MNPIIPCHLFYAVYGKTHGGSTLFLDIEVLIFIDARPKSYNW